jgi:hypothetical protein
MATTIIPLVISTSNSSLTRKIESLTKFLSSLQNPHPFDLLSPFEVDKGRLIVARNVSPQAYYEFVEFFEDVKTCDFYNIGGTLYCQRLAYDDMNISGYGNTYFLVSSLDFYRN